MNYIGMINDGEITLPTPIRACFSSDEDAPADSFSGVFPMEAGYPALTGLKINDGDTLIFDGIVDEQLETVGNSRQMELSARSMAALLLDNAALPQNYVNPSLATVFGRHIQPYGFTGYLGDARPVAGTLSVTAGMSEWQTAADFCARFLQVTPRVRGRIFDASGQAPTGEVRFDNRSGIRYASGTLNRKPCAVISEYLVKSGTVGSYVSAANNPEAAALGIIRKRCLKSSASGAADRMKQSRKKAFSLVLDCPGGIPAELFTPAAVNDPELGNMENLYIAGLHYSLDSDGEHCKVTLRRQMS